MDTRHTHHLKYKLALLVLVSLLCSGIPQKTFAQFYNGSQLTFGKNRVQHQNFNWQYMRAEQYDVYYYPTGRALAQYVFYKVPGYIREIEHLLNYTSQKKLQFIVYNTQEDFRESNFAYDDDDFYNQGGVTNVYGTKIYLYFDGNHAHLERMIRSGIMNVYAHWLVQGASVGSNMTYDYLMDVPNWYFSGLASYFGEAWNSDIDYHVKDGILTQRYADFDELSPVDATYAGHSFWKYVVDLYGKQVIPKILYNTRSSKNMERGFLYATKTPYRVLLVNWYKYYYVMYHPDKSRTMPVGDGLLKHPKAARHYGQFCFSPDGESHAYVTNEAGQIRVWLKTPAWSRPRCILKRFQKTEDNPDYSYPLLSWHPQGDVLGMTFEDKGHCYYYPYNLEKKKWEKRFLVDVEKITSWCYAPDGKMMLFSGFKNGQSDIYLYSFLSRSFQNLTNDFYDDYGPVFLKDQQQIVFASTRNRDTIGLKDDFMEAVPKRYPELYMYDYSRKNPELLRVTNTPYAEEYGVQFVGPQQIIYLSDKDGLVNRYMATFDSTISRVDTAVHYAYYAKSTALTDRAYSIVEQAYNPASGKVADISLVDKVKRIYLSMLNPLFTPEVSPSVFHNKIQQEMAGGVVSKTDSAKATTTTKQHGFVQVYSDDSETGVGSSEKSGRKHSEFYIPVGTGYRVQYSINKVITQADFSFLNNTYQQFTGGTSPIYLNSGLNALFMLGINDLFEDYRVTGGFRVGLNLRNYEFMLSYENLARRLDRQIILYRQTISSEAGEYYIKQGNNTLFYILKYPFNKHHSLRLTLKGRYETCVYASLGDVSLQMPDSRHVWAGARLEYIFDSSKELYTNLWRGTKLKMFAEYEQRAERETMNLFVVGLDARRSFKLYRNMTLALRAAASTNVGSARLVYYMGGVDNWVRAKFNSDIWVDQSKNYAYQTLATNMRGFKQNIRNGTSFVLFSGELRIPFVQLIAGRKLSINFLNSMQFNLFGDVGTAWTGWTPYSEDNCLYTRYIYSGPITVMVKRQVDPFVGGFGVGFRCSLLGYFLRLDYAWGVEDFKIANKKGMFMFSIGTDF
ncbi:MAG: PD40 domain-containing protein [Bacteroidales bacterium]|nr:PD40 domain-containing protein [Bacteroidales bacterium]